MSNESPAGGGPTIAINGLGRMGRLFLRTALQNDLNVVCCNDPNGKPEDHALGLEFDSIHGRFEQTVGYEHGALVVGDRRILLTQHTSFRDLPWRQHEVDLVVDCSGKAKRRERNEEHLAAGARQVLVSNPVPDVPNIVYGVNHEGINYADEPILTAASCTTNSLAPAVRVLHDEIGIERGTITTIHDPTNTQVVVDRPHSDARRARSALVNLIPTSTNSATAVTLIIPELKGRLDSIAVRVPVLNSSLTDCSFSMSRDTTVEEVNAVLEKAAAGRMRGVLGYETRPLVSSDYTNDPRSGIVDAGCTRVVDKRMVKVMIWYDNEWGYVNRMVDLVKHMHQA